MIGDKPFLCILATQSACGLCMQIAYYSLCKRRWGLTTHIHMLALTIVFRNVEYSSKSSVLHVASSE